MYSSKTGRFLQPDPIGYYDSANLYQYVGNNPINSVDPMGLCEETIDEKTKELLDKTKEKPPKRNPKKPKGPKPPKPPRGGGGKKNNKPWWPKWSEPFIPGYGNYGGPMRTDPDFGVPPVDSMDKTFQDHDKGWAAGKGEEADKKLYDDLINLPSDPKKWEQPPASSFKAEFYKKFVAEPYFEGAK